MLTGTSEGFIALWSWGDWGDYTDRFVGHSQPVNSIISLNEDTILTGCDDGFLRYVHSLDQCSDLI